MVVSNIHSNVLMKGSDETPPAATSSGDVKVLRRIIAEDAQWTLRTVPLLKDIVIKHIVNNFENKPTLKGLSLKDKRQVLDKISPKTDIKVTAHLVDDESYWKRCCQSKHQICDVSEYGGNWKRMFFERYMQNMIETFVPDKTSDEEIEQTISLCAKYITKVKVRQLLPPLKEPPQTGDDDNSEVGSEIEGPSVDHFDFGLVLEKLPYLEDFEVCYGVRDCGMNFEWNLFNFTQRDAMLLSRALKNCKGLKRVCIQMSKIDDGKCRTIVGQLLNHPSLVELDFSHNCIGDRGARAVAKLINNKCPHLETVNLSDNIVRAEGAKALAFAVSKSHTIKSLNLTLNRIGDEGGQSIARSLLRNDSLKQINLSSNELTEPTAAIFSQVFQLNYSLRSINLSCNKIGTDGGKQLQEGMEVNSHIVDLDLRLMDIGQESEYCINQKLKENQEKVRQEFGGTMTSIY